MTKYPLYKKTPFHKDVKKDDGVVFYVAGRKNKSQNFLLCRIISIRPSVSNILYLYFKLFILIVLFCIIFI